MTSTSFHVDLRGIVDLLSHHLYSSPRVYLRELIQNGVDAITALGTPLPSESTDRPGILLIPADVAADHRLHAYDCGIGLDAEDVRTFLATIGRSSKRDELGFARSDLLGQFGIGLLSCFLVCDTIEVFSRKAGTTADGTAHPVVHWQGHADGSYHLTELEPGTAPATASAAEWLTDNHGTCVILTARHEADQWLASQRVLELARHFASLLPHRLVVRTSEQEVQVAPTTPPWRLTDTTQRQRASRDYAQAYLGGEPFQVLPIQVPLAGLDGIAAISGQPSSAARRVHHRVHLKGMLVSETISDLLPEWAFFVRTAIDSTSLRPTASREALYDDGVLEQVRENLGEQIRSWLVRLAEADPQRMNEFLRLHSLAAKAMAMVDDDMLALLLPLVLFETNQGVTTVTELLESTDQLMVTSTYEDFRQVQAVAAAQGLAVVNGGYTYDLELLRRLPEINPQVSVTEISAADLDDHLRPVADTRLLEVRETMEQVRTTLDRLGVEVQLRSFAPTSLAALYLDDRQARKRRENRQVASDADDTWAQILASIDDGGSDRPRLLLNDSNPSVSTMLGLADEGLRALAAESLYCRALLAGHHKLRPVDSAALDRSFVGLLERAMTQPATT